MSTKQSSFNTWVHSDNGYMVECMNKYPNRFAAAMIVPRDDHGRGIRRWAERGIGSIRLPANARATCVDSLAHWRTAAEQGLAISAPSNPQTLLSDEFREVCEQFNELQIVIEHLAGAKSTMSPPYTEFKQVLELAQYSNLTIKLLGFGEFCVSQPFSTTASRKNRIACKRYWAPQIQQFSIKFPPLPIWFSKHLDRNT